jgi:hypothetical protein
VTLTGQTRPTTTTIITTISAPDDGRGNAWMWIVITAAALGLLAVAALFWSRRA